MAWNRLTGVGENTHESCGPAFSWPVARVQGVIVASLLGVPAGKQMLADIELHPCRGGYRRLSR